MPISVDNEESLPLGVNRFIAGMRLNEDLAFLEPNEYGLLVNGRSRNGKIKPINLPASIEDLGTGLYQAAYGIGSSLLVFKNGRAWVKDFASNSSWAEITGFNPFSTDRPRIFGTTVPSSYINYNRTTTGGPSGTVSLSTQLVGTPRCFIAQNGEARPVVIFNANDARTAQRYDDWTQEKPEYVPEGLQCIYFDGILYTASPNGTELYRSRSGRGLDYIIAIDNNGDKLSQYASEEASRLSHTISYDPITCLFPLNSRTPDESGILVSTGISSYKVVPNYDSTLFGESTFRNIFLFASGPLNQFSITEMLGDYGFIDQYGIKLFSAIAQDENEGRSAPISREIERLFGEGEDKIQQSDTCCTSFDNYGLFAVRTIHGESVVVYDQQIKRFVALDSWGVGKIKQFASIEANGVSRLFFITSTGLYEAFSGSTANCGFYARDWSTGNLDIEHRMLNLRMLFKDVEETGNVNVTLFCDGKKIGNRLTKEVEQNFTRTSSEQFPFGANTERRYESVTVPFLKSPFATNVGAYIEWAFKAELLHIQIKPEVNEQQVSSAQVK